MANNKYVMLEPFQKSFPKAFKCYSMSLQIKYFLGLN